VLTDQAELIPGTAIEGVSRTNGSPPPEPERRREDEIGRRRGNESIGGLTEELLHLIEQPYNRLMAVAVRGATTIAAAPS
jgi:hypothetical protein